MKRITVKKFLLAVLVTYLALSLAASVAYNCLTRYGAPAVRGRSQSTGTGC